jgi:alpha-D-ribose 1-methylphosphonate 5-triphosphate synthase subunit PhnH
LSKAFWKERIAMQPLFPRGADLLLVCGASLVGIPRSTHLTLEA